MHWSGPGGDSDQRGGLWRPPAGSLSAVRFRPRPRHPSLAAAVAFAFERIRPLRNAVQRHFALVQRVSGTVMVVMGVLIFTGALIEIFRYFQAVTVVL